MAITEADFLEICTNAQQNGEIFCRSTDVESEGDLPDKLGYGRRHTINLRGGLSIDIINMKMRQTLLLERQHPSEFYLTAKFYLSGSSRVQTKDLPSPKADYAEMAGCQYLYHLPDILEQEEWLANEPHHIVIISARPDYFRSFLMDENPVAQPLKRLLEGNKHERFHQGLGQITPAMSQVLHQVIQAPYQGIMQQMYLESKALELLTLQFAHWSEIHPLARSRPVPADELERLHAARAILARNLDQPLTLSDIAQRIGLNEYRFRQSFRRAFDTTPFGYLHHCRMQQAQHLLLNSSLTIAGVAARVGYRNPEAFSTAFRRQFNISPKAYQLGKRS
ncbi:MAG: AraC family transcriptional regulator [Cyanobacteria bacterium P01_D01_bin.6]